MSRKKVAIAVDSTACVPEELVKKYGMHVIPLVVNWDGETLRDRIDIMPDQFYRRLSSSNSLPTTSQPSVGEFVEFFSEIAKEADSIVGIFISEKLSGTLASARAAADLLPDLEIAILDSKAAASPIAMVAIAAAQAAEEGADFTTVKALAENMIPRTHIIFVVDTLEYLHKGGRIGGAQRFLGAMMSIKPLLGLEDGQIAPIGRVRTKKKAVRKMLDEVAGLMGGNAPLSLAVLHAAAPSEAIEIQQELVAKYSGVDVMNVDMTPVIGTHVGPGALGVAVALQA